MDSTMTSVQLVRLLAEESRRKVVAALILGDDSLSAAELAEATGLNLRQVVDAADRLLSADLLDGDGDSFTLRAEAFQQAARAEAPVKAPSDHDGQPPDIARVLDIAFKDGKLVQWPAKRSKRLIVLDHLVQGFDIGKHYSEHAVNDMLRVFNDDVATTRRYLVDEEFLDRASGQYWRCGGSV